jgi:hypothetical protein
MVPTFCHAGVTGPPAKGRTMPSFSTDYDRSTMGVIERWKRTADSEVDDIGAWRDADPDSDGWQEHWLKEQAACDAGRNETTPKNFWSDTAYLVGHIANKYPRLDPTPLQKVYDAVAAWHTDRAVTRIPPQPELFAMLEQAVMVVGAAEMYIVDSLVDVSKNEPGTNGDEATVNAGNASTIDPTQQRDTPKSQDDSTINRIELGKKIDALQKAIRDNPEAPPPDPTLINNLEDYASEYDDFERDEWSQRYIVERERREAANELVRSLAGIDAAINGIRCNLGPAQRLLELTTTVDEAISYARGNGGPANKGINTHSDGNTAQQGESNGNGADSSGTSKGDNTTGARVEDAADAVHVADLTVKGIADYIGISESTLGNIRNAAEVPPFDSGAHGSSFRNREVSLMARAATAEDTTFRCTPTHRKRWESLLKTIGEPSLDEPLKAAKRLKP